MPVAKLLFETCSFVNDRTTSYGAKYCLFPSRNKDFV